MLFNINCSCFKGSQAPRIDNNAASLPYRSTVTLGCQHWPLIMLQSLNNFVCFEGRNHQISHSGIIEYRAYFPCFRIPLNYLRTSCFCPTVKSSWKCSPVMIELCGFWSFQVDVPCLWSPMLSYFQLLRCTQRVHFLCKHFHTLSSLYLSHTASYDQFFFCTRVFALS